MAAADYRELSPAERHSFLDVTKLAGQTQNKYGGLPVQIIGDRHLVKRLSSSLMMKTRSVITPIVSFDSGYVIVCQFYFSVLNYKRKITVSLALQQCCSTRRINQR